MGAFHGPAGPMGSIEVTGSSPVVDWDKGLRIMLKVLGVRAGDRMYVERDGERFLLSNPLDEDVVRDVMET